MENILLISWLKAGALIFLICLVAGFIASRLFGFDSVDILDDENEGR